MSTWLALSNEIKLRCSPKLLTETQVKAYDFLCKLLLLPEWVNLYGSGGSGKTFLAWTIAQSMGMYYFSLPTLVIETKEVQLSFIIDNAPNKEFEVRRLLSQCELVGAKTVLLVTRTPVLLPIPKIELLPPSNNEIKQVLRLINSFGFLSEPRKLPDNPNFWDVMLASV